MNINQKTIVLGILLVVVIPMTIFCYGAIDTSKQTITANAGTKFQELARHTINKIDQLIYTRKNDLRTWLASGVFDELAPDDKNPELNKKLEQWKRESGMYSAIYYVNAAGVIQAASDSSVVGKSVLNEAWYKPSKQHGQLTPSVLSAFLGKRSVDVSDIVYDSLSGSYGSHIFAPIYENRGSQLTGMLVSRLNWNEIFAITNAVSVSAAGQSKNAYALLINRSGQILTGPGFLLADDAAAEDSLFRNDFFAENARSVKNALGGEAGYLIDTDKVQNEILVGYAASRGYLDYNGQGWAVLVVEHTADLFAPVNKIRNWGIVITCLSAVIGILLSLSIFGAQKKRLGSLVSVAERIGSGDLAARASLEGTDNAAELARAMNKMADAVQTVVIEEQDANRAKDDFLARLGYQLREPLNSIIDMSRALLETNLSGDQRTFVRTIRDGTASVLTATNDLLHISKMESGASVIEHSPFDLQDTVSSALEVVSVGAEQMGIEIDFSYIDDAPKNFRGDAVKIHQLVTTLSSYALRRRTDGKLLVVVAAAESTENDALMRIIIANSAENLSDAKLLREFELGVLGNDVLRAAQEGAIAPGLATSRRMAQLLGGSLGEHTDPNLGTLIWLSLELPFDTNIPPQPKVLQPSQSV